MIDRIINLDCQSSPGTLTLLKMPALLLHLTFGRKLLEEASGPENILKVCQKETAAFLLGTILPDLPYHERIGRQVLCHLLKRSYLSSTWGDILHCRQTGFLAFALLAHSKRALLNSESTDRILALVAGFLSHL